MPPAGEYLLTNVGFSQEKPLLLLQQGDHFIDFYPLGHRFTLTFTTSQRFCVGWRDITTGERFVCPNQHLVDSRYEQCATCQQRTGFNPAFYHAASISPQQQARNAEPHILYLAHFGKTVIKVGISHAGRGHGRLIEQGARSAIVLDTFPSADIARQYEAKIAQLPGIAETIQVRQKITLLQHVYQPSQGSELLHATKKRIETELGVIFSGHIVEAFDHFYFPRRAPQYEALYDVTDQARLSGEVLGMVGSLLVSEHHGDNLIIAMKKFVGYHLTLSSDDLTITLPQRQLSFL